MKKSNAVERNRTIKQVANHFNVTILTVQNWKKRGCPYSARRMTNEKGNRNTIRFSLHEVELWHKNYLDNVKWGRPSRLNRRN